MPQSKHIPIRENNLPSRQNVWAMFDRIAHRYDILNHLLSLGIDFHWRQKLSTHLPYKTDLKVLDLATGTADVLLTLCQNHPQISEAIGMDLSEQMLEQGRKKTDQNSKIRLELGDACQIPSPSNYFDVVTISFGIRNVVKVEDCLSEIYRVLNPQGRALILEFSHPDLPGFKNLYFWYLRHILPQIGGFISGDNEAYTYLNQTIETFPAGQNFANLMIQAGFNNVSYHPLSLGIATIYQGDKL